MQNPTEVKDSFKLLLFGSALTIVLWFIPFAEALTYPFRIFVTYIHEAGHALAALATFGGVNRIQLDWSGNGVTETVGGARLLISSAGYLSTTIYGSSLLLALRRARHAKPAAVVTAVLLLFMTVFFGGNFAAWLMGAALGLGLLWLGLKAKARAAHFIMSFLAVQSLLNAFYDLRVLMYLSAFDPARPTDAQNMASATSGFVPAIVWAFGWALLSMLILGVTLYIYYRSLRHRAELNEASMPGLITQSARGAADRSI